MPYCKNCGTEHSEDEAVCASCGLNINQGISLSKDSSEQTPVQTIIEPNVEQNINEPIQPNIPTNQELTIDNNLSNAWKVTLTALTLLVPVIGWVVGIVMGLIYLSSPIPDTRNFGKVLLMLTVVYIGIGMICCLGFMFLTMVGFLDYANQFMWY